MNFLPFELLTLALALPNGEEPFLIIEKQGPASLTVANAGKSELEVRLSGMLPVRLTVVGTAELEVQPIEPATLEEGWRLHPAKKPGGRPGLWQQEIVLEPLRPGRLMLTLPPLRYREMPGRWQAVHWKPITVTVQTSVQPDAKDLRDITSPEDLPERQAVRDLGLWIWLSVVGAGAVLLVVAAGWWRGKAEAVRFSPEQRAHRELDRVLALDLLSMGETVEFHFLVHGVVRRYLKRRYRISGRCRTTSELLQQVRTPAVPADQQRLLEQFLERCDPARFSGSLPTMQECEETLEIARRIVVPRPSIEV